MRAAPQLAPEAEFFDHESYVEYVRDARIKIEQSGRRAFLWFAGGAFGLAALAIVALICLNHR